MTSSKLVEILDKFDTLKREKQLLRDDILEHLDTLRQEKQSSQFKEKDDNDQLHNRLLELNSKLKSTTAERNYYKDKANGATSTNSVYTCPICQWSTTDSVKLQLHVQDCLT